MKNSYTLWEEILITNMRLILSENDLMREKRKSLRAHRLLEQQFCVASFLGGRKLEQTLLRYLEIKGEKKKEVAGINDPIETRLFELEDTNISHKTVPFIN